MSRRSITQSIIFALLPLLVLLILAEIGLRCAFYQKSSGHKLALAHAIEIVQKQILWRRARQMISESQAEELVRALHEPMGQVLLAELQTEYDSYFKRLVDFCRQYQIQLALLYIPTQDEWIPTEYRGRYREFFHQLTDKYHIDLIDLSDTFSGYSPEALNFKPGDFHLNRYGNWLVSQAVHDWLSHQSEWRSQAEFQPKPDVMGDHPASQDRRVETYPDFHYRVRTNKQGFRMLRDVSFPKTEQRILALGDSFTFGSLVYDQDTWPNLLYEFHAHDVVNAGKGGYTILQELELLTERARYVDPDVIILQVIDNDIYNLLSYFKNTFSRNKTVYPRTTAEKELMRTLGLE